MISRGEDVNKELRVTTTPKLSSDSPNVRRNESRRNAFWKQFARQSGQQI